MQWYKEVRAILEESPETDLAYLYGCQLESIPHLKEANLKCQGFLEIDLLLIVFIEI